MEEKTARLQSLNQSETEVLHVLFRDPNFKVKDLAAELYRGEGGIRTNLTAIFTKLRVPVFEGNKREWVVREYSEAYALLFKQAEKASEPIQSVDQPPEIFIKPPEPIIVPVSETAIVPVQTVPETPKVVTTVNYDAVIALSVFLGMAVILVIVLIVYVNYLSYSTMPIGSHILYYDTFDTGMPQGIITAGAVSESNGYLVTNDKAEISLGDSNWVDYVVYARVVTLGCDSTDVVIHPYISVRTTKDSTFFALDWKSCQSRINEEKNIKITVKGNQLAVKVNGGLIKTTTIDQAWYDLGGVKLLMDKYTAIDYILVTDQP